MTDDPEDQDLNAWDDRKSEMMEAILGKEHDMVMHAIIPYEIGGALDLYYYPHGIPGTAIATKELSPSPEEGSSNDLFDRYELVMFTRHPINLDEAHDENTDFGCAHELITRILGCIGPYSEQATLNPNETCEFPEEMENIGGKCLIFDSYPSKEKDSPEEQTAEFGLLTPIQIHRSEMNFAREHRGRDLIEKLKAAGYYPYSDLDRPPVA